MVRFGSGISLRQFKNCNFFRVVFFAIFRKSCLAKKLFFMIFFRCVKNFNDTFELHELILQFLKNIREFFQVDQMSNCEMVDHQKEYWDLSNEHTTSGGRKFH